MQGSKYLTNIYDPQTTVLIWNLIFYFCIYKQPMMARPKESLATQRLTKIGRHTQACIQLGTPRGANRRLFWEEHKFFKLCPIVSNYVQRIFPGGSKNFLGGACAPLVTGLGTYTHNTMRAPHGEMGTMGSPMVKFICFKENTRLKNFVIQTRYKHTTPYYIPMLR